VAVKVVGVLQPEDDSDLAKRHDELLEEIKVWGRLQNEHILPVLGHAYGHGRLPSLVFPWMENGSLTNFLRGHKTLERGERFRLVSPSDYDGIHVQTSFCVFSCKISPRHCNIVCLPVYKSVDSQVDSLSVHVIAVVHGDLTGVSSYQNQQGKRALIISDVLVH
jgi:hypothetical protein